MRMTSKQVDYLNIGLIVLSLFLAFMLPFQLFLFSYAVLGPLHYLTEINWLDGRSYFVKSRKIIWLFAFFALVFAFPFIFELPGLQSLAENGPFSLVPGFFKSHINGLVFVALAVSIALIATQNNYLRSVMILLAILLAVLFNGSVNYNLLIGSLVPTIIHVFVFTFLFMLYGALKSRSLPGLVAAGMVLLVPVFIIIIDIDPKSYLFTDTVKDYFLASDFHVLLSQLAGKLGLSDGNHFYFYEKEYLKIQIFMAFAYTYHYLNWYSKTSVIGWYKNLTTRRTLIIGILWLAAVGLYVYDYRTGFLVLVALSLLHVFAEFPLNVMSVKGIWEEARKI